MNIYCFSTLSFAKLQFKSVINKAFHKHGSHLLQMRGLKQEKDYSKFQFYKSHLLQMRGLKLSRNLYYKNYLRSHLLQMRGLKPERTMLVYLENSRIFYRCVD